jgi:SPP1 gp7 family putative phage head morphogenesis protein
MTAVYKEAAKDIEKKISAYTSRFNAQSLVMAKLYKNGEITQGAYQDWITRRVFTGDLWNKRLTQVTDTLRDVNQQALNIIHGEQMKVFAENYNFTQYGLDKEAGMNLAFSIYDTHSVERLIRDNPELLPRRIVDGEKDAAWNKSIISNCIAQGIIQGESIPQIVKRMSRQIEDSDRKSMTRYARTAMTCAQNSGRMEMLRDSKKMGIKVKKCWLATLDKRTRDAHAQMDGQVQEVEEPFVSELGEIMFPGDPDADDMANVYNCRCTLTYDHPDFEDLEEGAARYDQEAGEDIEDMTYDEWMGMKEGELEGYEVAEGEDITGSWTRRADEFEFEIDDVLDAQGFSGLPRLVNKEEFYKAVEESSFIAQRTYGANTKEILDSYRDQLYHGKWYVDCSSGKSLFGQGMYCSANYDGILTDGIKADMDAYRAANKRKGNPLNYTETMTLMPDAKIITYDELMKMKSGIVTQEEMNEMKKKVCDELVRGKSEEMALYIRGELGLTRTPEERKRYDQIEDKYLDLPSEQYRKISAEVREAQKLYDYKYPTAVHQLKENRERTAGKLRMFDDEGSAAAALGYDAISVDGNGRSGNYTVILNRTKCIILEGGNE